MAASCAASQRLLLFEALLLIAKKIRQKQHGRRRIGQQENPPGLLDERIAGPLRNLGEGGQLRQLHQHAEAR